MRPEYTKTITFAIDLALSGVFSALVGLFYVRFGHTLSNRKMFAKNFVVLAMTTMLVISVVKSSLTLSLGLVGALSIVRFRAAIKEPEELSYLFLTIAIGLGFGAGHRLLTCAGVVLILVASASKRLFSRGPVEQTLYITLSLAQPEEQTLTELATSLKKYCERVDLKRFDESKEALEATFLVNFTDFEKLAQCKEELKAQNENLQLSLIDAQKPL